MLDTDPKSRCKSCEIATATSDVVQAPGPSELDNAHLSTQSEVQDSPQTRIVVALSEPIFRDGLCALLRSAGFNVIGGCSDDESAVALARSSSPELLLLGVSATSASPEVVQTIRDCVQQCRVVLFAQNGAKDEMIQYLQLGVHGIIARGDLTHSLLECLSQVARGQYWLGTEGLNSLVQSIVALGNVPHRVSNKYGLTRRESEIILEVLEGSSNPEIAAHFSLSEQTVKHHVSHIFDKLGVYSRVELALFAVKHGITAE
jgi:DNA-binding NarL/FixJ family response regulator